MIKSKDFNKSYKDFILERMLPFNGKEEKRYNRGFGYDFGLDNIIDKQPKFNLSKINAKEVFGLLNSEDIKARKKAVFLLYKAYSERYLDIGYRIAEVKYDDVTPCHNSIEEDTFDRLAAELAATCETRKYREILYIFLNLRKAQTKPSSEKKIGPWLDDFVNHHAGSYIEYIRFQNEFIIYWIN